MKFTANIHVLYHIIHYTALHVVPEISNRPASRCKEVGEIEQYTDEAHGVQGAQVVNCCISLIGRSTCDR